VFQHVAVTYDGSSGLARLFVNGGVVTQKDLGLFTPDTGHDLYLGARIAGLAQANWWTGTLDEVAIYERALSSDEIREVYLAAGSGRCLLPPTLLAQPARQLVQPGCPADFSALAVGIQPLAYQWWKDDLPLDNQTNRSLSFGDVEPPDFATYRVVVSNAYGSVTSSPALLALDHLPVANADVIGRFAGGGIRVSTTRLITNDVDADDDGLEVIGVSSNSAAGGSVQLLGHWIYYTPPDPAPATDTFTYTVADGHCAGITEGGLVTVSIKPDDPLPTNFGIEGGSGNPIQLTFDGVPGMAYHILYCEDLTRPVWLPLASATADHLGVVRVTDLVSSNTPARYYRAIWP
jgi:hypothetical protein